jgi:Skp family chaperone for outer membrane proteins
MKIKTMLLSFSACIIILSIGHEYSQAQQKADTQSAKIGTVSIVKIFRNCKRTAAHKIQMNAEQEKIMMELEELAKQLKAQENMLNAIKQDSGDYLVKREEFFKMRADLEAQQAFSKEQALLKEYRWRKEVYQDILRIISELAEQKGLDLVLEKNEIDVSSLSVNELNQTMITHKVLYSGGCMDITNEVIARLDKEE